MKDSPQPRCVQFVHTLSDDNKYDAIIAFGRITLTDFQISSGRIEKKRREEGTKYDNQVN